MTILAGAFVFFIGLYYGHQMGYREAKRLYEPFAFRDDEARMMVFRDGNTQEMRVYVRPQNWSDN